MCYLILHCWYGKRQHQTLGFTVTTLLSSVYLSLHQKVSYLLSAFFHMRYFSFILTAIPYCFISFLSVLCFLFILLYIVPNGFLHFYNLFSTYSSLLSSPSLLILFLSLLLSLVPPFLILLIIPYFSILHSFLQTS